MLAKSGALVISFSLLGFFLWICLTSLSTTAPTFDEGAHLPAGYMHLETGRPLLNREHPPLLKLLAAIPLHFTIGDSAVDEIRNTSGDQWELGRVLMSAGGRVWSEVLNPARMVTIIFGLLLCLCTAVWAYQLGGVAVGLLALGLTVFCPTILAHTRLVTTDVPLAMCGVMCGWLGWRLTVLPRLRTALGLGLALGAALTIKFSSILFVASFGLVLLWVIVIDSQKRLALVKYGLLALLLAVACIPLVYMSTDGFSEYLQGIKMLGYNHQPDFQILLFGDYRRGGYWWYFPVAFLIKSSLAVLASMFIVAAILIFRRGKTANQSQRYGMLFLIVPALTYGIFMVVGAPQFGVRYLIPCLPFLFIFLAFHLKSLLTIRFGPLLLGVLITTHAYAALSSYPDPISYFNGLFGCQGYRAVHCLDDSNLDWGQDLGRAADFVKTMGSPAPEIKLLYFGTANPDAFFEHWSWMEAEEFLSPAPQVYVMSLQLLQRFSRLGGLSPNLFTENKVSPAAIIGNTYVVYDLRTRE